MVSGRHYSMWQACSIGGWGHKGRLTASWLGATQLAGFLLEILQRQSHASWAGMEAPPRQQTHQPAVALKLLKRLLKSAPPESAWGDGLCRPWPVHRCC